VEGATMKRDPDFEKMLERHLNPKPNPAARYREMCDLICDGPEREMFAEVRRILESGSRDEVAMALGSLTLRSWYHQCPGKYNTLREVLSDAIDDRN
jgi:hypothetical protein